MKMLHKILSCSTAAAAFAFSASTIQAQTIVNSGFEGVGAVNTGNGWTVNPISLTSGPAGGSGVNQGWATFGGDAGAVAVQNDMSSSAYTPLSGSQTLLETVQAGNNWGPAGAYQIITGITPGQTYTYSIWGLTDTANDAYSATAGVLIQLGFETAALGGASSVENPGGTVGHSLALPSTQGVWTKYSVTATAPAGYTDAIVYDMFQDNATATATENLYLDSALLVPAPEPTTLALAGLGGMSLLSLIRRRNS
jgi:hypothetical protein